VTDKSGSVEGPLLEERECILLYSQIAIVSLSSSPLIALDFLLSKQYDLTRSKDQFHCRFLWYGEAGTQAMGE
jgi:hypothetical protein